MALKSSYNLQLCWLPKLDAEGASIRLQNGLQVFLPFAAMTVTQAGRWRGHQLGVTTTNGLQVFLPSIVVLVTQIGHWRGLNWGSRLENGVEVFLSFAVVPVTQAGR